MLQRQLARENVDTRTRDLLAASGIRSYRQVLQRPLWDVARATDVSVHEMTHLISKVSIRLAPQSRTAFDMFLESVNKPMTLRTGLPLVDAALCGGIHCGALHEFAGSSGIGKTQVAMTLAVRCALEYPQHRVIYIDTERGFSAKRVQQIVRGRLCHRFSADRLDDSVADLLERIHVNRVDSLSSFLQSLQDLDRDVPAHSVKLIVVDSVAALLVKSHELTYAQRERHSQRIARQLKYIGDVHQAFVVVTNRASTVETEFTSFTKPLLGDVWAHCVTSRFVLERHATSRVITGVKCPSSGHVVQPFSISENGVEPLEERTLGRYGVNEELDRDEDEFDINDDVLRELDLDLDGLPTVDPSSTLRSTQQSQDDGEDEEDKDIEDEREEEHEQEQNEEQASDPDATAPATATGTATATGLLEDDDIVCDSNDESGDSDDNTSMWFR